MYRKKKKFKPLFYTLVYSLFYSPASVVSRSLIGTTGASFAGTSLAFAPRSPASFRIPHSELKKPPAGGFLLSKKSDLYDILVVERLDALFVEDLLRGGNVAHT